MLENIFRPLFEVTIHPGKHPELHLFLQHVRYDVHVKSFHLVRTLKVSIVSVPLAGCRFRQCGWWVQAGAAYLQPRQPAAGQLDGWGQSALLLLPLLYVCKHDRSESPAQVCGLCLDPLAWFILMCRGNCWNQQKSSSFYICVMLLQLYNGDTVYHIMILHELEKRWAKAYALSRVL